jgi:outer membrane protein, heavy metal efflux system
MTLALLALALASTQLHAQDANVLELRALVASARTANPSIQAARRMEDAAQARVPQAGALPDPVLSAGVMNLSVNNPRLAGDEMALAVVQIAQMIPAPGIRGAREAMARQAQLAAGQRAQEVELAIVARVKAEYYELYAVEESLRLLERNRIVLEDIAEITSGRLAVGVAPQQDVLRAQTEVTRTDEQISSLRARRSAILASINALLEQPASREFSAVFPAATRALALAAPAAGAFTPVALQGGLGVGLPTLAQLQEMALEQRPLLRQQDHAVQQAREAIRLAERDRVPGLEVMLGYGTQFTGGMSRVTAMVAVPVPAFAARKQRQAVTEAMQELAASEFEQRSMASEIAAEVAARFAGVVRLREQIVLLMQGVIPQAQATFTSASAAYQSGAVEFLSLLDAQAMLVRNEIELGLRLAEFGRAFALLEQAVGRDLIPE